MTDRPISGPLPRRSSQGAQASPGKDAWSGSSSGADPSGDPSRKKVAVSLRRGLLTFVVVSRKAEHRA